MQNRINWLREMTGYENAELISRAHLPRFLDRLDWDTLHDLIEKHFGIHIECDENKEWVAIDGKTLRGTVKGGDKQSVVLAVTHESRKVIAQARQTGNKSSEIPVVRNLLKSSGLEQQKITLDAHHLSPLTTSQIHQAGGSYIIQVKENQPILLDKCRTLKTTGELIVENIDHDKANGRVTVRHSKLFSMESVNLDKRWRDSDMKSLTVVRRETFKASTKKTTVETSYYVSNIGINQNCAQQTIDEKAGAIRGHWGVESDNYIRDKTLNEDHVKTKYGNQAQIMGRLRGLAMGLIRKTKTKNFQAMIDKFADCPDSLVSMLMNVNFL